MRNDNAFDWKLILLWIVIVLLYAFVSNQDFEDAMDMDCAKRSMTYDKATDTCKGAQDGTTAEN